MKARLKRGRIIEGRLAEIFVSRGLASEIKDEAPKRKRRTKAEIEADKEKKEVK